MIVVGSAVSLFARKREQRSLKKPEMPDFRDHCYQNRPKTVTAHITTHVRILSYSLIGLVLDRVGVIFLKV